MRTIRWCVLASLGLTGSLYGQSVVVGVGSETSAPVSSEFSVPVFADMRLSGGHLLGSYTIRVQWDSTVLKFEKVEAGAFGVPVVQADSVYGTGVLFVAGVNVAGQPGMVDLFRVKFTVLRAQTSGITLTVAEMSAAATFTDLKSLASVVNGAFCGSLGRWGDLDNDGFANSRDALAILSNAVGITIDPIFQLSRADVNADAKTNTVDALIILSYAVGLAIPGQRVLLPVPGVCAAGVTPTLAIVPDEVDVVVGQRVRLKLQATTTSGALVTFAATWQVADPAMAAVGEDGYLAGRAVGTTRVTAALGPGIQVSVPVVVRARRSTWHVNAPAAKRASVQLGTLKYPFSTPQRAFPLVQEGDTILVAPGVHDYELYYEEGLEYGVDFADEVEAGIVVLGDMTDGTRPVLRSAGAFYAFNWIGGVRGELRNLVLQGFYYGVYLRGLANLTVRNVRINVGTGYGNGIYTQGRFDSLLVTESELLGATAFTSGYAIYVDDGGRVLAVDRSTFDSWDSGGIYGFGLDSVDVRDSDFSGHGVGIEISAPLGPPTRGATVLRNQVTCGVGMVGIRVGGMSATLEDNAVRGPCRHGIDADNPGAAPEFELRLTRDTVLIDSTLFDWTGVRVLGNWRPILRGNRVRKGYYGIEIATTGLTAVVIDSNAVSQAGSAGILINVPDGADVSGRKNNIQNNLAYGIKNEAPYTTGSRSFTLSNIVGNTTYGLYNLGTKVFEAMANWWGNPGGPGMGGANPVSGPTNTSSPELVARTDVPPL